MYSLMHKQDIDKAKEGLCVLSDLKKSMLMMCWVIWTRLRRPDPEAGICILSSGHIVCI